MEYRGENPGVAALVIDLPTRFIDVDDHCESNEVFECCEVLLPEDRELLEECVGLRFGERQTCEHLQDLAGLIDGNLDTVDKESNGNSNLDTVFSMRENIRKFSCGSIAGLVQTLQNARCLAINETGDGDRTMVVTILERYSLGVDVLYTICFTCFDGIRSSSW